MPSSTILKSLTVVILILTLASCGGGGSEGDDGGNTVTPPANQAPTANAGEDQTVNENSEVTLTGSGSDSDGSISSYSWTQTSGTEVTLTGADSQTATFTAPEINGDETLSFEITVTDDDGATDKDQIDIQVVATTIIANNVSIITQSNLSEIAVEASNGDITVDSSSDLASKNIGEFIVAGDSDQIPGGLLKKITGKKTSGNQIVFETTQAALTEVVQKGSLRIGGPLDPLSIQPKISSLSKIHKKISLLKSKAELMSYEGCSIPDSEYFVVAMNAVPIYGDVGLAEGGIEVNGCVGLQFDYELIVEIDDHQLKHFKLAVIPKERREMSLTANIEAGNSDISLEVDLYDWYLLKNKTFFIGAVPVVLDIEVELVVGVNGELGSEMYLYGSGESSSNFGIEYTPENGFSNFKERTNSFELETPSFTTTVDAEVYAGPELFFKFYKLAGPEIYLNAYLSTKVDTDADPWWEVTGGIRAGLGAELELPLLDHNTALSANFPHIIDFGTILGSADGAYIPPLDPPTNLIGEAGDETATLTWTSDPNANSYNLYKSNTSGVTKSDIKVAGITSPHSETGLTNGENYYYAISSQNAAGESNLSNEVLVSPSQSSSPGSEKGLIAYYDFNGDVNDKSGSGLNGNLINSASIADDVLDLTNSYDSRLEVVDSPLFNIENDLSVVAWVKKTGPYRSSHPMIVVKNSVNSSYLLWPSRDYTSLQNSEFAFRVNLEGAHHSETTVYSGISAEEGKWYHIAGIRDETKLSIFVDGELAEEIVIPDDKIQVSEGILTIGDNSKDDDRGAFNGQIDEVRIYDKALTAAEVKELYDAESFPEPVNNLTVSKSGQGTISSSPSGINCGSDCSQSYNSGTSVTLTASASSGYTFTGWGGSCSGSSSTCTVTMNQDKSVSATFSQQSSDYTLTVTKSGQGTISSSPSGINCGSDCSQSYNSGTSVTLTASASSGYTFTGWGGSCSGNSSTCTVTMNQAKSVSATFSQQSSDYTLTVTKSGQGTISSSPSGINCGSDCSQSYNSGTSVTLTASASSGYTFTGWGGSCSGNSSTCTVTMNQAKDVSAAFDDDNSTVDQRFVGKWVVNSRYNTCDAEWQTDSTSNSFEFHSDGKISSDVCSSTFDENSQSWSCFGPKRRNDRFADWEVIDSASIKIGSNTIPYLISGNELTFNPITFTCNGEKVKEDLAHKYTKN